MGLHILAQVSYFAESTTFIAIWNVIVFVVKWYTLVYFSYKYY